MLAQTTCSLCWGYQLRGLAFNMVTHQVEAQIGYSSEAVSFGRPSGGASRGGLPGMLRPSTGELAGKGRMCCPLCLRPSSHMRRH